MVELVGVTRIGRVEERILKLGISSNSWDSFLEEASLLGESPYARVDPENDLVEGGRCYLARAALRPLST